MANSSKNVQKRSVHIHGVEDEKSKNLGRRGDSFLKEKVPNL